MTELRGFGKLVSGLVRGMVAVGPVATLLLGGGIAAADPPGQPDPTGTAKLELGTTTRDCDFNPVGSSRQGQGAGFALIGASAEKVVAEVDLVGAAPNTTYDVRLIALPSMTCSPGAPGVGIEKIGTDASGNGNVVVQTALLPRSSGAWVTILDGSGQLYSSNAIAPVVSAPTRQIDPVVLPETP